MSTTTPSEAIASSSRSSWLVAAGILLSRTSGIIREIVLGAFLGVTTIAAEAFAFALTVPKMLQNLLGEGALSASFIPVYSQLLDENPRAAQRTAGAVFGLLAALVSSLVLVLMVAAKPIVQLLARGASAHRVELMADLLRIMAPGVGFIVFAAWCLGVLNSHRDFFVSYVAPVIWNAAIAGAVLLWALQTDDITDLARAAAWGVFIGGVAQFAVQLPRVLRIAGPITPSLQRHSPEIKAVLARFVPGVAGRGVVTLGTFVDLVLALFLGVGALSVLGKAQTLLLMPIAVFAASVAAADLPELSRSARGDVSARAAHVQASAHRVVFFLLFSTVAFIAGGRSLVSALFERGKTSADDTIVVWLTLAVFSIGLVASGLSRLLQSASFAQGDVAGPARIAAIRLGVAAVIGAALMFPADRFVAVGGAIERIDDLAFAPLPDELKEVENMHRLGAVGLACGSAVAAWVEFALLRKRLGSLAAQLRIGSAVKRLLPSAAVSTVLCVGLTVATWDMHGLVAAPITIGISGGAYVAVALARGNPAAAQLVAAVTSRIR